MDDGCASGGCAGRVRPVSDRFLAEVKGSHTSVTEVWAYRSSGEPVRLEVSEGSVNLNSTSAIRGSVDLSVPGLDWVPKGPFDLLAPYGNELNVLRGVEFADGSRELVSLGWFGIQSVSVEDDGSGLSVRVSGLDRSQRLSAAVFEDVVNIPADTPFAAAILFLALDAWPDCPYQPDFVSVSGVVAGWDASALSIGRGVVAQPGDNRWDFMLGLAKALGMVLFFDGDGILTLRPYAEQGVVASVAEGEGGVLLSAGREWGRSESFNRVIATGENTSSDEVYRAVATDDNPLSPTYYFGDFGKVPRFYSSPYIVSVEQAQDAANAILLQEIGTASTVSFGMVPNPALEPEDTVRIVRERVGVSELHIIDDVTIGLAASDSMSGSTRERLTV